MSRFLLENQICSKLLQCSPHTLFSRIDFYKLALSVLGYPYSRLPIFSLALISQSLVIIIIHPNFLNYLPIQERMWKWSFCVSLISLNEMPFGYIHFFFFTKKDRVLVPFWQNKIALCIFNTFPSFIQALMSL